MARRGGFRFLNSPGLPGDEVTVLLIALSIRGQPARGAWFPASGSCGLDSSQIDHGMSESRNRIGFSALPDICC